MSVIEKQCTVKLSEICKRKFYFIQAVPATFLPSNNVDDNNADKNAKIWLFIKFFYYLSPFNPSLDGIFNDLN